MKHDKNSPPAPLIAIVGMGGIFPQSATLDEFWSHVATGRDCSTDVPEGRWAVPPLEVLAPGEPRPDKVTGIRGCFVEDFALDPAGLDLDPELLRGLDQSFHLLLHAGRQALHDALPERLNRKRTGVILGNIALPTDAASKLAEAALVPIMAEQVLGSVDESQVPRVHPLNRYVAGLPAGVLAKALGLAGGTMTLDAACASSLYAIKLACDELTSGRASAMLTGGMSRPDHLYTQMGFSQLHALSPTGHPAPFDAAGNGLVVGEGAGVLVLKRLSDAIQDGNTIHAVIRGIGLSNDTGGSLLAPDSEGQLRAMRTAYEGSGLRPADMDLVECHATGTPLGDAVEFGSLCALWSDAGGRRAVIGSVKSNIGHLLTGAGAAGVIKVLLAMRHGVLPPTANFRQASPRIDLPSSPFEVLTESRAWPRREESTPRRAAVSAFGFGGINAHVLLEEYLPGAPEPEVAVSDLAPPEVAIVGLGARLGPWKSVTEVRDRLLGRREDEPRHPVRWWGAKYSSWFNTGPGGGLPREGFLVDQLDITPGQFRIPPRELPEMLPQQLIMLQVAAEALADAGIPRAVRHGAGVFIGLSLDLNTTNYHLRWILPRLARQWARERGLTLTAEQLDAWVEELRVATGPALNANRTMGGLSSIIASRIAREFHFGGPSFALSSEETSGLKALQIGAELLRRGELGVAVAGAVDLAGDLRAVMAASAHGAAPETPPVALGEGAACVVLKRLEDARRDGNRVYALLRPGLETTDSRTVTFSAEHTADSVAIPLEAAFGAAGAALGMAGVVAAALAVASEVLPGGRRANGRSLEPRYWIRDRQDGPRRAAVLSANVIGERTGVVVEEAPDAEPLAISSAPMREALFLLDGSAPGDLLAALAALERIADAHAGSLHEMARTWWKRHPPTRERALGLALVASSTGELKRLLPQARVVVEQSARLESPHRDQVHFSPEPLGRSGRLAFVYPGSGNHFPGMGRDFALAWPETLRRRDRESATLASQWAAGRLWTASSREELTLSDQECILAQVSLGCLVTDVLRGFGLRPEAAIGYSLGESAALFSLDAWRDRDEMLRRVRASTLFTEDMAGSYRAARQAWNWPEDQPFEWTVGVVNRPAEAVRELLPRFPHAALLIVNTPRECVLGGEREAVRGLVTALGAHFFALSGVTAVHCEVAAPVREPYRALHLHETKPPEGVRFYSGNGTRSYDLTRDAAADSILAQALHGIDYPATIRQAYADGVRLFVEIGPGGSCTRMIDKILGDEPHFARAVCQPDAEATSSVLRLLAALHAERVSFDPSGLYAEEPAAGPKHGLAAIAVEVGGRPLVMPKPPTSPPGPLSIALASLTGERRREEARPARAPHVPAISPAPTTIAPASGYLDPALAAWQKTFAATATAVEAQTEAHAAYLRLSQSLSQAAAEIAMTQARLLANGDASLALAPAPENRPDPVVPESVYMDRQQCMEFAIGRIGAVLGERYTPIDAYPTRVRLPDEPLMLVDRILSVEGEALALKSGRVVTEHDVLPGAWYLDAGRAPTCIAVESGQADLFLSGWLGIDFKTRGIAMYRLLDATITFHRHLPLAGETLRHDIRITTFFRQGETYLFRFEFDSTIDGQPVLMMRNGIAGFFTPQQLLDGKGLVLNDWLPAPGSRPADWRTLAPMAIERYGPEQLAALRQGDMGAAFGELFARLPVARPLTLPPAPDGRMKLLDRVTAIEPSGGRFGNGLIRAEMDIHPDDWFLVCHFSDDQVMPGTLMYECCLHTFRVFLLRMGWVADADAAAWEPKPGVASRLVCRGQVLASTKVVTYEVHIRELGYDPAPYAIGDALMSADDRPVVLCENMSLRLSGATREQVEGVWQSTSDLTPRPPLHHARFASGGEGVSESDAKAAVFIGQQVMEYAIGEPSRCFGPEYRCFDHERFLARLPGPPYLFVSRITEFGGQLMRLAEGSAAEAQYDIPAGAWYFEANRSLDMPFAILLEVALQVCGWLSAAMGSALTSPEDLHYRNLGGTATQLRAVTPDSRMLTTRVVCTKIARTGGMVIQNFTLETDDIHGRIYRGHTYFGFFRKEALAEQVGLRGVDRYAGPDGFLATPESFPAAAPFPDERLRMMDRLTAFSLSGGPHGLGLVRGEKSIRADEWFFAAHFFQDPVWPGSLGLEAFLQLLKVYAARAWSLGPESTFETVALGEEHAWSYRGQVVPGNRTVVVEAIIRERDDAACLLRANGLLIVDGKPIYEMKGFTLRAR